MITATHKGKYYDVEYSIVNVSELDRELRIDAEYYDPYYIQNLLKLKQKGGIYLSKNKFFIKRGVQPKYSDNQTEYLALNSVHILDGDINFAEARFIDQDFYFQKIQFSFKYKDILVNSTGVGTLGRVAYMYEKNKKGIVDNHITRIRILDQKLKILPEYLFSFLRSRYGQLQIERLFRGSSGQIEIYPSDFTYLFVPIPSEQFQKQIEKLVLKAYEERQKAEQLYKQAKEILLEELGLKNWKPKTKKIKICGIEFEEEENISIRMLSEVMKADRMDAEHWEPKYDELEEKIRSFEYEKLYKLASNSYETFNPENCDYFYYLEIANVDLATGDYELKKLPCSSVPSRAKKLVEEKDILVSTVRPNRNAVAFIIRKDKDPFVASTGFCKLRVTDERILPEYLFGLFKTDLYKELLVRKTTATMYPAVSENDIMQLDIPILSKDTQEHIKDMIIEGFQSKENSKKLLEIAKRTVEIYIENDEDNALKYAKKHIQKLHLSDSGGMCNDS